MNPILAQIDVLHDMGAAFADIRVQQGRPMMVKGPKGWCDTDYVPTLIDIMDFLGQADKDWQKFLAAEKQIDRSLRVGDRHRLRINAYTQDGGEHYGMVIRRQSVEPIPLSNIGLPVHIEVMTRATSGLILVNGPTGAGKTTTLAAIVDEINSSRAAHIVTVEQPIEYEFQEKQSVFTQREVGMDTHSFSDGVKAAMRQAPDVIMIGEIRDRDTCEAALRGALSGHLVLASTHGSRAVNAIQRMFSFFPEEPAFVSMALQNSLIGVIAQQLLPSTDGLSYVVAAEILNGRDKTVQDAIASPEKLGGLEESLRTGRISMSNHFNVHLRQLIQGNKVEVARTLAASPAMKELKDALGTEAMPA